VKGMLIGVKFCGNCNPVIDSPGLLAKIEARLNGMRFVGWHEPGIRALLVLNGCRTGCATIPEFKGPVITVAGGTVQRFEVDPQVLDEVLAAILLEITPHR